MKNATLMLCFGALLLGCDKPEKTVYFYMQNQDVLEVDAQDCNNGKLPASSKKCQTLETAKDYIFLVEHGLVLSEKRLRELGKED
ncbi:EexN family lipoprotein [Caviibacterium pharyngocola]|uniref:Lipoprotein n=1 Tax=Caviibacterium pharyngocola TaxID=28159 RepID=A0A2M8RYJ8_9PAST|nr:EexN family lipoprotein [Caviibacterium pharyngocola]PJG83944.1 hypothetical protein CVP04_02295 [Caviibacterium pharyngocola]